jgi:hypothetical protein
MIFLYIAKHVAVVCVTYHVSTQFCLVMVHHLFSTDHQETSFLFGQKCSECIRQKMDVAQILRKCGEFNVKAKPFNQCVIKELKTKACIGFGKPCNPRIKRFKKVSGMEDAVPMILGQYSNKRVSGYDFL